MAKNQILLYLKKGIDIVSEKENYSKIFLWLDFAFNFFFYRFTPKQYIALGVYKMRHKTKGLYVNSQKANKIEKYFNDTNDSKIFCNKALFNAKFSNYVKRKWINAHSSSELEISSFIKKYDYTIAKPIDSSGGRGIFLIKNIEEALSLIGKQYLIEEIVTNMEPLRTFSKRSLNTIRIFTLVDLCGKVNVLSCSLRIGGNDAITDNMHTGGHAVPIDFETGILCGEGKDYCSKRHEHNPVSGIRYFGLKLPRWEEVKKSIADVVKVVPTCRYCAWDIAITDSGIEYIEGNVLPDPSLLQLSAGPKYLVFKELMNNGE